MCKLRRDIYNSDMFLLAEERFTLLGNVISGGIVHICAHLNVFC
jgi:hypothetical protein